MLFEDFMKPHEVDIDVFFQCQEGFGGIVCLLTNGLHFSLFPLGDSSQGIYFLFDNGDIGTQVGDSLECEGFYLGEVGIDAVVEIFFGDGGVGGGQLTACRVGGGRGGEGDFTGGWVGSGVKWKEDWNGRD